MRYPLVAEGHLKPEAIEAGIVALRRGSYSMGEHVREFERLCKLQFNTPGAVMVNSGSSANLLAMEVLRRGALRPLRRGDEVLVPALGWSTSVWPVIQLGLRPVFVDIDPATLCMDLEAAEKALTRKTRGMVYIDAAGYCGGAPDAARFCASHGLVMLEDACEAVGASVNGKAAGTFGHLGTYSFYYSHQLPTIEGGLVLCKDEATENDLRSMRAHGWDRDRTDRSGDAKAFRFVTSGYNLRPMDLQGAIGCVQLPGLAEAVAYRRQNARHMAESLEGLAYIANPVFDERHSWMFVPIARARVREKFEAAGIETRPLLGGCLLDQPALKSSQACPEARVLSAYGFMVGCHGTPHLMPVWDECIANVRASLSAAA